MARLGTIVQWVALWTVSAGCHSPTELEGSPAKPTATEPAPSGQITRSLCLTGFAYADADGDGYTPFSAPAIACTGGYAPVGYKGTVLPGDCDDTDPKAFTIYYRDADGDGLVGAPLDTTCAGAEAPAGYLREAGPFDCDDTDAATSYPYLVDADGDGVAPFGAATVCGPKDHPPPHAAAPGYVGDCDDNDPTVSMLYYRDLDGDGFAASNEVSKCGSPETPPPGFGPGQHDCDDTNADVNPAALELWTDMVDSDCDGSLAPYGCPDETCDPSFVPVPIDAACGSADLLITAVSPNARCNDVKWVVVVANMGTAPLSEFTLTIESSKDTITFRARDPLPPGAQRSYPIPRRNLFGEVRFSVTTPAADCNPANDTATTYAAPLGCHDGGERVP